MMCRPLRKIAILVAAIGLCNVTCTSVEAVVFGFDRITANSIPNPASQLTVDVTDAGGGNVNFRFVNAVGIASSITEIYFQDGLLGAATISDSDGAATGVEFSGPGAIPANLPGGSSISPPFVATTLFSVDIGPGNTSRGLNQSSEWLNLQYGVGSYGSFAGVIAALNNPVNGALRIGLHVRGIDGGTSDSFVNTPVPEPSTYIVGGLLLIPLLTQARRLKRSV